MSGVVMALCAYV